MNTIYGSINGNKNGCIFFRDNIWISHSVNGNLIIDFKDRVDETSLTINAWDGVEQDQFDNGVREATDDLINALMHCKTVLLKIEPWSGHVLMTIDGKVKYRILI